MTKTCRGCRADKDLAEFYRHPQMLDGHLNHCKDCVRARAKRHRRLNEHVRAGDRQRAKQPHHVALKRKVTVAWRKKNPQKYKAQNAVNNAIRDGKLTEEPCYFCGAADAHAHHADYSRPLDVTWLCPKCHHRLHAMEAA